MHYYASVLISALLFIFAIPSLGGDIGFIGSGLKWYSRWKLPAQLALGSQTCIGKRDDNTFKIRCSPLDVVVHGEIDDRGHCYITYMGKSLGGDADFNFGEIYGRRPELDVRRIPRQETERKSAYSRSCEELPFADETFTFDVLPLELDIDEGLTNRTWKAAADTLKRSVQSNCAIRSPNVRARDPFAHVYVVCNGKLREVWEFQISQGEVGDYPQWSYYPRRGGFPAGSEARLLRRELWFAVPPVEKRLRAIPR